MIKGWGSQGKPWLDSLKSLLLNHDIILSPIKHRQKYNVIHEEDRFQTKTAIKQEGSSLKLKKMNQTKLKKDWLK